MKNPQQNKDDQKHNMKNKKIKYWIRNSLHFIYFVEETNLFCTQNENLPHVKWRNAKWNGQKCQAWEKNGCEGCDDRQK